MNGVARSIFVFAVFLLSWVALSPAHAAVDLTGRFTVDTNLGPLNDLDWHIVQSGTSLTIDGGSISASGTIDPDTGAFSVTDNRPFCSDMPGSPGTITGTASDSNHFSGTWTTDGHGSPYYCSPFTFSVTGFRNLCDNNGIDPGEQCDGGQCCATDCRFAENGLSCDDGNPMTSNDQCANGTCGQLTVLDFPINSHTAGSQSDTRVAAAVGGNVVVVWRSFGQDGQANGIFGQRFASTGGRLGTEFQVNTYTKDSQWYPAVAASGSGFLVVWQSDGNQDGSYSGVFAQRYTSSGARSGTEFQVNTYTTLSQGRPSVAMDAAGNTLVAWNSYSQDGIIGRRYDSNGAAAGTEFQVNSITVNEGEGAPVIASIGANSFVVVWTATGVFDDGIHGRLIDATGPLGTDFTVTPSDVALQSDPAVAADPTDGDFLVTWEADDPFGLGPGFGVEVLGRRFASNGTALGGDFLINSYIRGDQVNPTVTAEPLGTFLVLWQSPHDGASDGVFGQRFASDGTPLGSEFLVNTYGVGEQNRPAAAQAGSAPTFVSWTDWNGLDGNGLGVFGRLMPSPVELDVDMTGRWTEYIPDIGIAAVHCTDYVQSGTTLTATACDMSGSQTGTINPMTGAFSIVSAPGPCPPYPASDLEGFVTPDSQSYSGTLSLRVTPASCLFGAFFDVSGVRAHCGDYYVDPDNGEQCDDGNNIDGDCCSASCQLEADGAACVSDGNPCTDDQCNATGSCLHLPNSGSCDDGLFCTGTDTCSGGTCIHTGDPCPGPDGDADCAESCDESGDTCTAADPDGSTCDDGSVCTSSDSCSGGACVGVTNPCNDNNPCTADSCDPLNGCANDAAPASGCKMAGKSTLLLKQNGGSGDRLVFKWSNGEPLMQTDLADPTTTAQYDLCVFGDGDNEVLLGASVPPSATNWSPLGDRGYKYADANGSNAGIVRVLARGNPIENRSKVTVTGKGTNLPDPTLGNLALPVKAQLINRDTGVCVEASFDSTSIKNNDSAEFKAKNP